MEDKELDQHIREAATNSNIIFGTSSDDIQQGLDNNQYIDTTTENTGGDEDQIVNEQDQNQIVNPSEETFNEEPVPQAPAKDNTLLKGQQIPPVQLEENVVDLDPDKDSIDGFGKISKAED